MGGDRRRAAGGRVGSGAGKDGNFLVYAGYLRWLIRMEDYYTM
jgi:hypothetical protein